MRSTYNHSYIISNPFKLDFSWSEASDRVSIDYNQIDSSFVVKQNLHLL
jgi:hypothetical protein